MRKLGIVFIILGILFLIGHLIFAGPTYATDEFWIGHNDMLIGLMFLFFAGISLLLADWNLRNQENRKPGEDVEGRPRTQNRIK